MWTIREHQEEVGFAHSRVWWLVYDVENSGGPTFRTTDKVEAIKLAKFLERTGFGVPMPALNTVNMVNDSEQEKVYQSPREGMLAMALSEVREHGRTLSAWSHDMARMGRPLPDAIVAVIAAVENANG